MVGTNGDIAGKEAFFFVTHFSFCHSFLVPAIRPYLTSGLEAGWTHRYVTQLKPGEIVPLQAESHSRTVAQ